jgi:death on curing protein
MTVENRVEPIWLTSAQIRLLHSESIRIFGGVTGLRDEGLLESALSRPRNRWAYDENVTLHQLAAELAFGLSRNHPFIDGNKRISLLSIRAFLHRNGRRFAPELLSSVTVIENLAAGSVTLDELAEWILNNVSDT